MDDLWIAVVVGVVALVIGLVFGREANVYYVQSHCDKTGQMLVEKAVYTCAKK